MGVRASLILVGMVLVLQLVGTSLVAVADSSTGQFAIQGRGGDQCRAFVEAREAQGPELLRYMDWVAGYITAFNQLDDDTVDIVPWQGMELLATLLGQHCQAHPELSFARAVSEMTNALYGQRLREESAIVSIKTDGGSLPVYDAVVRRMQVALNSLGYYGAEANGKFDEPTRSAIRKFQASEKIKETGLPDQETLYLLFLKAPAASGNDP